MLLSLNFNEVQPMDTKQLTYFMKVYEFKSINAASKELFISSQGLNKIIQKLEAELNVPLFIKQPKGVIPTQYADKLYSRAQNIISELKEIITDVDNSSSRKLIVGCTNGVIRMLSLKFIYDFREKYPDIILKLYDSTDITLEQMLWNDKINLCILSGPINTIRYNSLFFTSCDVCVVTNKNNPLAQLKEIRMEDLTNEPLIISSPEYHAYLSRTNAMSRTGSKPNIVLETMDIDLHSISANQGYASALTLNLPDFIGNYPNIKIIPFATDIKYTWDTYLTYKKGRNLTDDEQIFCTFAINWIRHHRPELMR